MANILSKIFKQKAKTSKSNFNDAISMVAYEPSFSKFGSNTLYSSLVYSAIQMKARYFGKLEPRHIRNEDGKPVTITDSDIAKVLKRPNDYQTTYDFLNQAYFMRRKDKTCYIYYDYYKTKGNENKLGGIYVLLPSAKPVLKEDENTGELYYVFAFDGYNHAVELPFDKVTAWKDNIEDNQYMGGGKYDNSANADLLSSLEAYHEIKDAIKEAAKLGCMFDGYLKINAYAADNDKAQTYRNNFVNDLRTNKVKLPVLDNGAEYVELKRQLKMVDAATLKEIKENALISEGVTVEMLTGKMTIQDKEAFYENHIEPAAISLGQAMSKVLFSQWQTTHGDQIILYPHKVQLMATSEIVSVIQATIAAGIFMKDEVRDMLGYAPLPNGEGQTLPRGYNNLDGNNNNGGGTE